MIVCSAMQISHMIAFLAKGRENKRETGLKLRIKLHETGINAAFFHISANPISVRIFSHSHDGRGSHAEFMEIISRIESASAKSALSVIYYYFRPIFKR